ncbi:methyltransferase [Thermus scotoductus]|uniref:Methyltransferase n=2 Tax=Thermus TaxID=270 RepID=A0A0N0ZPF3_THESC|nr:MULTISPECIES: RsmD family RNA methyltransferase [Thermus]MBW6394989.1 RsmD family RNA methyltransferase [Thermus brevis]KPD32570.1 methyltransferase [Thermus scotoductus]QWK21619.1 MAG: RsmD family RNA methyltransferase [Thermus antranikianii]RTG94932.1 methyltransferase [Thermus scotoductus]RTG96595.1 methyltransferase [Thermus scotoductus]
MVRILGGKAKGVPLKVPASARPSPVRLRKALFDYLRLRYPKRGRFLDLYAGSGAVGLEAASEGFEATLVEKDQEAVALLKENLRRTGLRARIVPLPVEVFLPEAKARGERYTVAFMAPPYPLDLVQAFQALLESGLVEKGGLYILQHPKDLHLPFGERRVYGENALTLVEA